MIHQFCVTPIGLLVVLFITSSGGNMAFAQQGKVTQGPAVSPSMSMAPTAISKESFVNKLNLKMYEAQAGDPSLCSNDQSCELFTQRMKSLLCAAGVCDGTDKSKEPTACFGESFHQYALNVQEQINPLICSLIKSPTLEKRQKLLSLATGMDESDVVQFGAVYLALKGSAEACENYIKDYLGPYSSQWGFQWYEALSGCSIIAHKSTREQEENDFYTWYKVTHGSGQCSKINNKELHHACNTSEVTFPI